MERVKKLREKLEACKTIKKKLLKLWLQFWIKLSKPNFRHAGFRFVLFGANSSGLLTVSLFLFLAGLGRLIAFFKVLFLIRSTYYFQRITKEIKIEIVNYMALSNSRNFKVSSIIIKKSSCR